MKEDKFAAIQAASREFARLNGDIFVFSGRRWWYLNHNHLWIQAGAREQALRQLPELVAYLPADTDAQRWVARNLEGAYVGTQILALAGQRLWRPGLPGPGFTPQIPSSEL